MLLKPCKFRYFALLLAFSSCTNLISSYSLPVVATSPKNKIDGLSFAIEYSQNNKLVSVGDRTTNLSQQLTLSRFKTDISGLGFRKSYSRDDFLASFQGLDASFSRGVSQKSLAAAGFKSFEADSAMEDVLMVAEVPSEESGGEEVSQSSEQPPEAEQPPPNPEEEPPQLDAQPNKEPNPSSEEIEERLEPVPVDYQQRQTRLLERLNIPVSRLRPSNPDVNLELGELITQINQNFSVNNSAPQIEQTKPPKPPKPPRPFGYFRGQVNYFQTNNLFSSQSDRINDGLVFAGLRFVTAPIPIGKNTFLTGSVGGNVIRYINQSEFNYNQFRVKADIFHRFNRQMYGEIGWSNQQLFYARDAGKRYNFKAGDKFLNEHAWHVSIGRRDRLSSKLMLDSYYELRASFANPPENRDRIINTVWLALNYYWERPLMVGLNYQYYRADFTQRDRDDSYHRLFTSLNYRLSNISSLNFQGGYTLGDSTQSNIDFDGWFMSLTYGWELGRF